MTFRHERRHPFLSVSSMERSLRFSLDDLGFEMNTQTGSRRPDPLDLWEPVVALLVISTILIAASARAFQKTVT